ncbi:MAG: response regulator transcription factor [Candidatus Dormibacteraceae bacterium]
MPFGMGVQVAARILVVEDDRRLAEIAQGFLERAGYEVVVAHTGADGLRLAAEMRPDLTLLDFELPDMDAIEILDILRAGRNRPPFPVLVLTGERGGVSDHMLGLEHGASDYIVKGVDRGVILARIRVLLRDNETRRGSVSRGALTVDSSSASAFLDGRPLNLDRKPLLVLYQLMVNQGLAVSRSDLLRSVWNSDYPGFERSVDQAVYIARKSLGDARWIETVHGFGYRFRTLR